MQNLHSSDALFRRAQCLNQEFSSWNMATCHYSCGLCCLLILQDDDDAVNAEAFISKASFLVSSSQHEVLNLQYKV
jgi:uncharacterized cysteine cluster protein YcgN (CxxCxxCC family)